MQANPRAKRLWRQWERFSRSGIKVNQKSYSSAYLLAVWATVLVILYFLLWISRREFVNSPSGRYKTEASFQKESQFWYGRHLIFCISPGRAGSLYLRNLLDSADDIIAKHEPDPKMNDKYLEQVILKGKREQTLEERAEKKLKAIRDTLEGTSPDVAYAETSHMFVKTMADAILHKLANTAKISIIFLHRPAKDTIFSQLRLGWFSKDHSGRNVWYYDPNDVHESEKQISYNTNSSNVIDSLIGYNADVLQRGVDLQRLIKQHHKDGDWKFVNLYETTLASISGNSDEGIIKLLSRLGLKVSKPKLKLLRKQDTNARDIKKDKFATSSTVEDVAKRLEYMSNKIPLLKQVMYS